MLASLYSCFSVKKPYEYPKLKYEAAGCLFTNKTLILAGYQPGKSASHITGIGGTRMPGEMVQRTAFRELLEELFHVEKLPDGLLDMIEYIAVPSAVRQNGNYAMIILSFDQLEIILKICRRFSIKSPLYETIPVKLTDLIFNRRLDTTAEITHLTLIPFDKNIKFDPYFIEDIALL